MSEPDPLEAALTRALDRIAALEATVATHGTILVALREGLADSGEFCIVPFGGVNCRFTRKGYAALEKLTEQGRGWLRYRLISNPLPFISAADVAVLSAPDPKPEPAR